MRDWPAHPEPVCDQHRPQQAQGADVRGHQGRRADERQARRRAVGSQDPHEGHHDHRICKLLVMQPLFRVSLSFIIQDTYHDSLHKGKSVGAVVASMNSTFTKFM